jgi:hypothetical protein
VTVFCLVDPQLMGPPKSLKRYPSVLRRVVAQFPKLASLAISRVFVIGWIYVIFWLFADAEYLIV